MRTFLIFLLAAAPGFSATVLFSSAEVNPGAFSPDSTVSKSGTTSSGTASLTSTFGSASFSASAFSITGFGVLKDFATVTINNYQNHSYETQCGPSSICGPGGSGTFVTDPARATSDVSDMFTITGGTGTGWLEITFAIDGTTSLTSSGTLDGPIAQGSLSVFRGVFGQGGLSFVSGTGFTGNKTFTTAAIQFTYGQPFALTFDSAAFIDPADYLTSATLYNLSGTANFGSTITVSQLAVFGDAGATQPVNNFTVTADSGTIYPTASQAATPEPASLCLIGAGLGAVLLRKRLS